MLDGLFTTPVYSRTRDSFVNSAFPKKKKFGPQIEVYLWQQIWKQMFAEILRMLRQEDDVLPRATEPPFLSALYAKNDTKNLFGYKALLFCSGKETIQTFNGSI